MYSGVPIAIPGLVSRRSRWASASVVLAMPKSSTLTTSAAPSRVIRKMFSGLRSRWMMPSRRAADLAGDLERPRDVERALALDHAAELDALQVLHDEVRAAVGGGAGVGDVDDVGVADLGRRARLAAE